MWIPQKKEKLYGIYLIELGRGAVRHRSSKAQGLYNVFNAYDKKADDPYALKKIHDVVNGYFDRSSKARVEGLGKDLRDKCGFDLNQVKNYISDNTTEDRFYEVDIDKAISRFLRKTLSYGTSRQGFKNILLVYTGIAKWNDSMSASVFDFLETYHADYDRNYSPVGKDRKPKSTKNDQMEKSVRNQNLLVQPASSDGGCIVLSEVPKSKETKKTEKEAFSTFLSNYGAYKVERKRVVTVQPLA